MNVDYAQEKEKGWETSNHDIIPFSGMLMMHILSLHSPSIS
jgi:hypothetical protein